MQDVFAALRPLLADHVERFEVLHDAADHFELQRSRPGGKAEFVASSQIKKHSVAFHHFRVYQRPVLLNDASSALRARMQGKSCFDFQPVDPLLIAELERLTARALA